MLRLDEIAERIRLSFDARTAARDAALARSRTLTRHCAQAIRAIHRDDRDLARQQLAEARHIVDQTRLELAAYPDLYHAGYTQDALKEFAEAEIVCALLTDQPLPTPEELGIEYATFLQGLADANGELRRRCLDILRNGYSTEAERLLAHMDDIYAVLVTMDYPDAITGGLRRLTDIARSINERTRGDLTLNLRQAHLEEHMRRLHDRLDDQAES